MGRRRTPVQVRVQSGPLRSPHRRRRCGNLHRAGATDTPFAYTASDLRRSRRWFLMWDARSAQGDDIASDEPGGFGGKVGDDVGHVVRSGDVEVGGTCRYAVTHLAGYPAGVCDALNHHIRGNPETG